MLMRFMPEEPMDTAAPATSNNSLPMPPGDLGLPWIGETLAFVRDSFAFFAERRQKHGPVFRTRLLGEPVVCLTGPEAVSFFYDARYFTRVDASLPQLRELLHPEAIPFLDQSPAHTLRRQFLMHAFTPEALAGYVPCLEEIARRYLADWERAGSLHWVPELQAMCFDTANALFAGAPPDVSDLAAFASFARMSAGFLALPVKLPFTRYGRALKGRDQLRAYLHERIAGTPRTPAATHVLGRLREARGQAGEMMGERELEIETLHLFFGAFAVITGALVNVGIALADHPDVRERVRKEVEALAPSGPLDLGTLTKLTYLTQVSKEVRRYCKLVPTTFFARVKEDCELSGYRLPAGLKAIACLRETMHDPATFPAPETFDPDRFSPERAEDQQPDRFIPHGGGPWDGHRCAGQRLAELMIQVYITLLIRDYTWELPSADRALTGGELVPMPKNGLPVRFARNAG
jgi:retinoid hydroxylase